MPNILWKAIAWICSRESIATWLIKKAQETPYTHIYGKDGVMYMGRWWLFNPYPAQDTPHRKWQFPISIRIHHIKREDDDRHLHDHPWNARTIIIKGWYTEIREDYEVIDREVGATARLNFGEYHRITSVSKEGAWTIFITGKYRGTWGFKVDGKKVKWRTYLGC